MIQGWNDAELPRPTEDLSRIHDDIDRFGYGMLANALAPDLLAAVRHRLTAQAAAELEHGKAFEDAGPRQQWGEFVDDDGRARPAAFTAAAGGVNQRVWLLPNKGPVFLDVLELDDMHTLVSHVLGAEYLLSSYSANIAKPGGLPMHLHTDQWWAPEPTRPGRRNLPVGSMTRSHFDTDPKRGPTPDSLAPAACSNVIFMINDFSEANGGTRLVPGSHLAGRHPDPDLDQDVKTVAAQGPAGTAFITDGRIWHGTGTNTTTENRMGMLLTFCGPQYRPQVNYPVAMDRDILSTASDRAKTLFGLKIWWGYGRTGDPNMDYIDPDGRALGILHPGRTAGE